MVRDVKTPITKNQSSFLSCEKDFKLILKKLFIENPEVGEQLIRLLVINTDDCLDDVDSEVYKKVVNDMTLAKLCQEGYVKITPKVKKPEHEEFKSYILMSMDGFERNDTNPEFRDCVICFHIVCPIEYWDLGDFRIRPLKIAGYIDEVLNNSRLSGIGKLEFVSCSELLLDQDFSGYTLGYRAVRGSDDEIPQDA